MVIRRRHRIILLVMSFLLVSGVVAGASVGTARPASADPLVKICLTNAPTYCADVMNSLNTNQRPIWLYRLNDGANDYKWIEITVPCSFQAIYCEEFENAVNPNWCLADRGDNRGIVLIGCELAHNQGGTARAEWYYLGGNNWANLDMGAQGLLTVDGPLYSGRYLFPAPHVNPGGAEWQQWTITGTS